MDFCRDIVEEMVTRFGVSRAEAVARVNRRWSDVDPGDRGPRIWIVGLDIVYHEDAAFWACDIYYGHTDWWKRKPGTTPEPLPPP